MSAGLQLDHDSVGDSPNGNIGKFTSTNGNQRTLKVFQQLPLMPVVSLMEPLLQIVPLVGTMVPTNTSSNLTCF